MEDDEKPMGYIEGLLIAEIAIVLLVIIHFVGIVNGFVVTVGVVGAFNIAYGDASSAIK